MTLYRFEISHTRSASGVLETGFIDETGAVVIDPLRGKAYDFFEGRARIDVLGRGWGIIDESGKFIVEPTQNDIGYFSEGLCAVRDREKGWGFVDRDGRMVIPHRIRNQWGIFAFPYFSEGLCAVPNDDGTRWGYIDRGGNVVIPHQFGYGNPFAEGLAVVEDAKGRASYIDHNGKAAFEGHWKRAWRFDHGIAAAGAPRGWGIIDRSGAWLHEPEFVFDEQHAPQSGFRDPLQQSDRPLEFHQERSLYRTEKKKWGYLSPKGEMVIPAVYDKAGFFSDGLAPVLKKVKGQNRWGLIDLTGKLIVPHIIEHMDTTSRFCNGLVPAAVRDGYSWKWGYLDRSGVVVIPCTFDAAYSFRDGLASVWIGGASAYIDVRGEFVWRAAP